MLTLDYTLIKIIYYFFIFLFGSCIGSFLNVCIYRIPLSISVAKGRSFCPSCHTQLRGIDMIPVFSFLFLGGKCHQCKHRISLRYPIVEALTGFLFLLAFYYKGLSAYSIVLSLFFSILIIIAFIDYDKGIIPDRLIIFILLLSPFSIYYDPAHYPISEHVIGFFIVSLPLLFLALFGGFGGGDIKLMAVCGFMMSSRLILTAALFAILSGAFYSVTLLLLKKATKKSTIPFGPFLTAGMIFACLWGEHVVRWYISLLTF